jgi:sec-independent protein translocase protein TatC
MSVLEHLDELRSRLTKIVVVYVLALGACGIFSQQLVAFLLRPIRKHLFQGGDIVYIQLTEPFLIYFKASALIAIFVAAPFILYQLWAFVAPGLYRRERKLAIPFLVLGSLFFLAGGAFGYAVATPAAAGWLIELGRGFRAAITLRSAFAFQSQIILAMGAVFETPILIFFLARLGLVTPRWLIQHFRMAVLLFAIGAAVLTPTGDMITMSLFVVPMVVLYLLGVLVAWAFGRAAPESTEAPAPR